jgi:hypothetical protein
VKISFVFTLQKINVTDSAKHENIIRVEENFRISREEDENIISFGTFKIEPFQFLCILFQVLLLYVY